MSFLKSDNENGVIKMLIAYRDELGVVCQEVENGSISFLEGKVYFTSNGIDFIIDVFSILQINGTCSSKTK